MSRFRQAELECRSCSQSQTVEVAVSIDASSQTWKRESILSRDLHRFTCNSCGTRITADTEFLYTEVLNGQRCYYSVKQHNKGYEYKSAAEELNEGLKQPVPANFRNKLNDKTKRLHRVVFGLDELREKLVATDANIEDTQVELAKLWILREHPVLLSKPRLRLRLERVSPQYIEYIARFDHAIDRFRINVPKCLFDSMKQGDGSKVGPLVKALLIDEKPDAVFEDGFVNVERLNPQSAALARLRQYVEQLDADGDIDFTAPPTLMDTLASLPTPRHLPKWAMAAIQKLIGYTDSQGLGDYTKALIEAGMNVGAERQWGDNKIFGDAENLFSLLDKLPDGHVQGNTHLDRIDIDRAYSWYDPTDDVISIAADRIADRNTLKDYLYHEVGHSVHSFYDAEHDNKVTNWLKNDVGFLYFGDYDGNRPPNDYEIDEWVTMMGGYGCLDGAEKTQCRDVIKEILDPNLVDDNGEYLKTRPPLPDSVIDKHPFDNPDFGPMKSYINSSDNWWENVENWNRNEHKGEVWAFAFNYYYKHLMAVKVSTINRHLKVLQLGQEKPAGAYAFYSPWEFFAEIYRVYYDPSVDENLLDPKTRNKLRNMLGEPEKVAL